MPTENPSIISHVSLGTNRFAEARAFYEKLFAVLGGRIVMEHHDGFEREVVQVFTDMRKLHQDGIRHGDDVATGVVGLKNVQ